MYVHTVGHAHLFSSVPAGRRLLCSVEEQATLLRGGLEEGGVHLTGLLTGSSGLTTIGHTWNT